MNMSQGPEAADLSCYFCMVERTLDYMNENLFDKETNAFYPGDAGQQPWPIWVLIELYKATKNHEYLQQAIKTWKFVDASVEEKTGVLKGGWIRETFMTTKNLVEFFRITGEGEYLNRAKEMADAFIREFWDEEKGAFPGEHHYNCWAVTGLLSLYQLSPDTKYLGCARRIAYEMIERRDYPSKESKEYYYTYLKPYAFTMFTLVKLYEVTKESSYLDRAKKAYPIMIAKFWDTEYGGFCLNAYEYERHRKYTYSAGVALFALSALYRATEKKSILGKIKDALDFLYRYHFDQEEGGFYGAVNRKGGPYEGQEKEKSRNQHVLGRTLMGILQGHLLLMASRKEN